jgi:hypothetical protein
MTKRIAEKNRGEELFMSEKITIHKDENGVVREYREVKRPARFGEIIKTLRTSGVGVYKKGDIAKCISEDGHKHDFKINGDFDGDGIWSCYPQNYVVLEPTDVVIHEGKRYREVNRAARDGELVKIVKVIDGFDAYQVGDILKVVRTEGRDNSYFHQAYIERKFNDEEGQAFLWKDEYVVLEPLDDAQAASETSETSSDRIAALEKTVDDLQKRVDVLEEKLEESIKKQRFEEKTDQAREIFGSLWKDAPKPKSPTRDEIVERAKKDVETLVYYGKSTDGYRKIPGRFGHIYYRVKFNVNREKRTVVALIYEAYADGSIDKNVAPVRGIAKCAPDDVFNVHIGKAIALRRALGLYVPDEYINAPQPTEPRVGDIVRDSSYNMGRVNAVRPHSYLYADEGLTFVDGEGNKWWRFIENVKIIDDSRDGYDYNAQRAKKVCDAA